MKILNFLQIIAKCSKKMIGIKRLIGFFAKIEKLIVKDK